MRTSFLSPLFLVSLVCILLLNGCAYFPQHKLKQVSQKEITRTRNSPQFVLSYRFHWSMNMSNTGTYTETPPPESLYNYYGPYEKKFVEILESSGYFSEIYPENLIDPNSADIRIRVEIQNHAYSGSFFGAVLTGLTFFIIPSWMEDCFTLHAVVEKKNNQKWILEMGDRNKMVQWLPCIVVAPFSNIQETIPETLDNLTRNLIDDMKQKGLLTKVD